MGEVYLAHDSTLDRKVGLKILPPDVAGDGNRMRRFAQEAKAAAALGKDVAGIYAGLGEKDQIFVWLEKDFQAHAGQLSRIKWELLFESVRSDPRYADLLRRMCLKP